jgi:type IV pilus assembly protein PilE
MKDAKGFTLIELMIVVAVVGILSMIALPQYTQYVIRGNRAAAEAFMMDVANRQKQYLLDARSYAPDLATLTMTTPTNVLNNYTVAVSALVVAGAPPTFTVTATVVPGSKQANDGGLTLNDLGTKLPVGKW